jgi:acyl-homoserine lactone synthase
MIHIITSQNRNNYRAALEQHFRIRHDIYVGERKWMQLAKPDGLERDQFDTEEAIYLLAIDRGKVIGGSRLLSSLKPHLLSEVFPHLALKDIPRGPNIYEWTRVHVIKERREGRNRGLALGNIFCGILEYCLANEIVALTAIVEMWWLPHFHEMGWTLKPLGMPELISGEWSTAVLLEVNEATLASTRAMFDITGPVFTDMQAQQSQQIQVLT